MEIFKKFLSFSRLKQIAIVVCFLHFLAIAAMTGHHFATRRLRPAKPISVKTFVPKAAPPLAVQTTQKPATSRPATVSAAPKKVAEKPATQKKQPDPKIAKQAQPVKKAVAAPAEPKTKPVKEEKALQEIAESLQSIAAEPKSVRPTLAIPAALSQPAKIPLVEESNLNPSYGEFLTAFLQSELELPEQGDVKIQIAIDSFGKMLDCQILDSRSSKNEEFLKNRLPELVFPCFNVFGITDLTQTFTITFRNVENP